MAVTIQALEELVGQLQLAERVEVSPTLVIGLGGSGTWTARRLKKLMRQRYGIIPLIRFLFVDCDQDAFTSKPELADVQDDEKVVMFIRNPGKILQEVRQGIGEDRAKWQDWLPEQLDVDILRHAIGAGGIRPVGRFALFASLQEVWERLDSLWATKQGGLSCTIVSLAFTSSGRFVAGRVLPSFWTSLS
jgi:hypothetical protein